MKKVLCFGDSNTWGYNPVNGERFSEGIRWTSRLQEHLYIEDIKIIEQGLCGRTTVYEDRTREGKKGIDSLHALFQEQTDFDYVIFMLGTNDCKKYYRNSAEEIASGVSECLDVILQYIAPEKILLISPIRLGEQVWKEEFDPEFDVESVQVSKELKGAYQKVAETKHVAFLAASEYVEPSLEDQEHMDRDGHRIFAEVLYRNVKEKLIA